MFRNNGLLHHNVITAVQAYCSKRNAGKQLQYIHVFCDFKLIKCMCFGSILIYPHEEFLIPRPPRTRSKFNPHLPAKVLATRAG